jgi:membrane-bound ClpP family serine protease
MIALGFTLLVTGAALAVAEAHVPAGAFGVAGGLALMAGGIITIAALGGGVLLTVLVGAALAAVTGGWVWLARHTAGRARRIRVRAGAEAMCGHVGVVRRWSGRGGQVFVDGALWRAREALADEEAALSEGDTIVVLNVSGLTLSVRRAEDWELIG